MAPKQVESAPAKRTEKHETARNALPAELRAIFDEMVVDYKYTALVAHGATFVSYPILAELVRLGWRPTAKLIKHSS